MDKGNILYLYDLPKDSVTSIKIEEAYKAKTGESLPEGLQIRRDLNKPFYSGMIKFSDQTKLNEAAKKMKFFEIDKKPCRALPFDRELLGSNKQQLANRNIFLKGFDKNLTPADLYNKFGDIEIKSLKVSLNDDHTSRGYGFITLQNEADKDKAFQKANELNIQAMPYAPKDRTDLRKTINNAYVKNFPTSWTEDDLRKMFQEFGTIKSIKVMKMERGGVESAFGFVCFEDPSDKTKGPQSVQNAIAALNGRKIDGGFELYVKEFLPKQTRMIEKSKEMLRFKNSKKRCNLYVRNFPPETTEDDLRNLFSAYGKIESIRLFPDPKKQVSEGEKPQYVYAFVCFENPDHATLAKTQLNQTNFNGKTLFINNYEIKELRRIQQEDLRDKADYQTHKKQNPNINLDIMNRPEVLAILQQLLSYMQQRFPAGGFRRRDQAPNPRRMNQPPQGMPQPMGQKPPQMPMPMPGMPGMAPPRMMPGQMPPVMMPQGMPQPMPQGMPPMMMAPPMAQLNPAIIDYMRKGAAVLPAVSLSNPQYKNQVGEVIYEYVEQIGGEDNAPKITGMLIDLPIEDIKGYLQDFNKLTQKVNEAKMLLQTPIPQ